MSTLTIKTTGLHPATASCLEALQWLHGRHECHNALDIGCGNGILSLTTAALWNGRVLAADIAHQAVADSTRLCAEHHMEHLVTVIRSDGFQHPLIAQRAPYDLVICNLLAEPITQWAPQMHSHLITDGICLLSGILEWLAPPVEAAYLQLGFTIIHRTSISPWATYLFRRGQ